MSAPLERPTRALAIGAHPDDVEFGCGATLAKWSAAGAEVHLAVLTDGAKGTWDPDATQAELARLRRREQARAGALLGVTEIHHLDWVDGELGSSREEQHALVVLLRRVRPDVVLGHDPWKRYRLHPDHRHAGFLTIDAIVAARDPHFFAGEGAPHRPSTLLLFEADAEDHYEPLSDRELERKVEALLAHESQWHSTMGIVAGSPDEAAQREAFADTQLEDARRAGAAGGVTLAEAFKRIDEL